MATGKIRNLVKDRGFGFIQVDGSSDEVFFHTTSLANGGFDDLNVGQALEFDVEPDTRDPRRRRAVNVKVSA
jgi:CspA family cold shock protein